MVGYNHSMEWTWNPYGMEMESIWNGSFHVHSMSIPYGFHSAYGMRNGWGLSQSHSIWIPWNGHGIHMDSIWINPGRVKTSFTLLNFMIRSDFLINLRL